MATNPTARPELQTGSKQTMSSWAKVIESYAALPEVYRAVFDTLSVPGQSFPYTVLAPPLVGPEKETTEKVVCDCNDIFYVLERVGDQVVTKAYPLNAIRDVEMGNLLLYSWLTISGVATNGVLTSSTIEFNTATSDRFAPFVEKARPTPGAFDLREMELEQAKFDYLASASFKFMNYARTGLVNGEKVIYSVWQPEIREKILSFFGLAFYRTISTAHLIILTDKELILIREDERSRRQKWGRYGGVWQYLPLQNVALVSLTERSEDLLTFSIRLEPRDHVDKVFAASCRDKVERLKAEIEKLLV